MNFFTRLGLSVVVLMSVTGCSQDVDETDVQAAQEAVEREHAETEETRRKVHEKVAREEMETEATIKEVNDPDAKEVREEENETAQTQLKGNKEIDREEAEDRAAEEKLADVKAKLMAQKMRDEFLKGPQSVLTMAAERIEKLQSQANAEEGDEKKATESQLETLEGAHDELESQVKKTKSVNPLKWQEYEPKVVVAQEELEKVLKAAKVD